MILLGTQKTLHNYVRFDVFFLVLTNLNFILISYSNVMHSTEANVNTFSEDVL